MLMCNSYDVNEDGKFKLRDLSEAKCHSENDTGFDGEKKKPRWLLIGLESTTFRFGRSTTELRVPASV